VTSPIAPHTSTPAELKERLAAARTGLPFIVFRDGAGHQHIVMLPDTAVSLTIGRGARNGIVLDWDGEVSRVHATVERIGASWMLSDAQSSNGSFVNKERLAGRHRLEHGDLVLMGTTALVFCEPDAGVDESTVPAGTSPTRPELSDKQRCVLTALCRPFRGDQPFAIPPTNRAIADEVSLSVDAVKGHLRKLFEKFGIEELPQNKKRARLVALALQSGVVGEPDFDGRR
jgi:pSer/pThr/pTyr-binding forkhead associated (FHA) protein